MSTKTETKHTPLQPEMHEHQEGVLYRARTEWPEQPGVLYTVEHHGWHKGLEQFRNRVAIKFEFAKSVPVQEREEWIARTAAAPDLLEALQHMQICRECAEGDWADCDGGRAALAAIAKARKEAPTPKEL